MSAEYNLKLKDLAQIALGTPELNNINIALLQSLMEILLKKLNCENEEVSLNAYEARHLENMLKSAKLSPLAFNDDNVEIIAPKLERLDNLQQCIKKLDEKVSKHLEEIQRKSNFGETAVSWENWSSYGCEDLCTTSDPENEMACKLLKNTDFLKKLLRRISSPMVNRMFYFEDKISKLNEEFSNFIQKAEEEFLKIQLLEKCILEIESLRQTMEENETQFLNTMEEIQDMLDSKLDKIHMPALKKYITDNFKRIDLNINRLNEKKECQQAAGIIMEGIRCVSCGNSKVCSGIDVPPTSILPDITIKPQKIDKHCGRLPVKSSRIKSLNLGDVVNIKVKRSLRDLENVENYFPTCRKAGEDFDLVEGVNGHLYRRG
ncbi:uncharacterized protein ACRADG_003129 [Cochliomyia hominivorax]